MQFEYHLTFHQETSKLCSNLNGLNLIVFDEIKFETQSIHKSNNIFVHFKKKNSIYYMKLVIKIVKIISCQRIPIKK
jgi:hypothetical protein